MLFSVLTLDSKSAKDELLLVALLFNSNTSATHSKFLIFLVIRFKSYSIRVLQDNIDIP